MAVARTNELLTSGPAYRVAHKSAGTDPQIASTRFEPTMPVSDLTLVFLHGAAHDETCWQYRWTDALARQGWRCLTLSYRAHGKSIWSQPVRQATLDDYVADVETVLQTEGLDPHRVLLHGHSLGGGVALRYAEQHEVAGLVLVASLAYGFWATSNRHLLPRLFLQHPLVFFRMVQDPGLLFRSPGRARDYLLGQDASAEAVQWCLDQLGQESWRASRDILSARTQPLRTRKVLVLGGTKDALIPLALFRHSAARLGAEFQAIDAPHDLMLANWQHGAEAVARFAGVCQKAAAA